MGNNLREESLLRLRGLMQWFALVIFMLSGSAAWAQFSTVGNFTSATLDPGWTING